MSATSPDGIEAALKLELLQMDIALRRKQAFWETPKAILLIVATTATVAGLLGYHFGSAPPAAPIIIQIPGNPTR